MAALTSFGVEAARAVIVRRERTVRSRRGTLSIPFALLLVRCASGVRLGHTQNGDSAMKSAEMRCLAALGIASALLISVTSVSFAQRNTNCIPHYDSSGA